jgi:hypothetical protein
MAQTRTKKTTITTSTVTTRLGTKSKKTPTCTGTGSLVHIDGRDWCVGEKIVSKWKHSKRNRKTTKKRSKTTKTT